MDLRQRLFAGAPNFTGAANLFDNMWRDRRGKGGGQQRKKARLMPVDGETARAAFSNSARIVLRPSTRPAWENVISR